MTQSGVLRVAAAPDLADLETFLGRTARIHPAALVRLRADPRGHTVAAYTRLPFGVLVGRTVPGVLAGAQDVTVGAAELAAGIAARRDAETGGPAGVVTLPNRRDAQWRGSLPPATGWRRLDTVPVADVRHLVEAGVRAFRAAQDRATGPRAAQAAADVLLGQDALTVSDGQDTVVLPLRVCHAAWRMGFLGDRGTGDCSVSVAGRWARLTAPFGTAYRDPPRVSLLGP